MSKSTWKGTILIKPVCGHPFYVTDQWTWDTEQRCWYINGNSYPEEICELGME